MNEDLHYCLKCKKTLEGLDTYILHRKSNCFEGHLKDPSYSKTNSRKEFEESFVNDVIDLSTSGKKTIGDSNLLLPNVSLNQVAASSDTRQCNEEDSIRAQHKRRAFLTYDDYEEIDGYNQQGPFSSAHSEESLYDYKSTGGNHCKNRALTGVASYSESNDLFVHSQAEVPSASLCKSLQYSLNDHLKTSNEADHGNYFDNAVHVDSRYSDLYNSLHRHSHHSETYFDSEIDRDYAHKYEKTVDPGKHLDKAKVSVENLVKDKKSSKSTVAKNLKKPTEDLRQDDFLSSLELTSNVTKKITKDISDEEEDFDASRPPRHHTGGKWPPGCPPQTTWLLSPVPTEDPDEDHVDFEEVEETQKFQSPPPSYTKGKWLPGKRLTSVKYGTCVEYECTLCKKTLKGKTAFERHLNSKNHAENDGCSSQEKMKSNSLKIRLPREKKSLAKALLKKTILQISGKKELETTEVDELITEPRTRSKAATKHKFNHNNKILCPVCDLHFDPEYCAKHITSLAHIHNELEYKRESSTGTDDALKTLVLENIESIAKLSHFKCSPCQLFTNSYSDFKQHFETDHNTKIETKRLMKPFFKCSACSEEDSLTTLKDLKRHLNVDQHMRNARDEVLQAHQISISTVLKIKCSLCSKSFRYHIAYRNHRRKSHGEDSFQLSSQRILQCTECQYIGTNVKDIKSHLKIVHHFKPSEMYFCFVCGLNFRTSTEAESHRQSIDHRIVVSRQKGKETSRTCNICYDKATNLTSLRYHMKEKHSKEVTPCPYCGILPPLRSDLTVHLKTCPKILSNAMNGAFNCDLCSFSNDLYAHVLLHTLLAHGKTNAQNQYTCHICKIKLLGRSVKNHMLFHTNEWRFSCPMCSRKFAQQNWLLSHIQIVHSSPKNQTGSSSSINMDSDDSKLANCSSVQFCNKKILCEICGKTFRDNYSLKRHTANFHESETAEEKATEASLPSIQLSTPTEEPQSTKDGVMCDICGETLTSPSELKCHKLIHRNINSAEEKIHLCPHCDFSSIRLHHLKRHLRLHSGATPFRCPYCNYSANNQENLRKHMLKTLKHSGRYMYECQICISQNPQDMKNTTKPSSEVFCSNYATDLKVHLTEAHNDHFKDRDEIQRHIRSYYYSEQDALSTKHLKLKDFKPKKRSARQIHKKKTADVDDGGTLYRNEEEDLDAPSEIAMQSSQDFGSSILINDDIPQEYLSTPTSFCMEPFATTPLNQLELTTNQLAQKHFQSLSRKNKRKFESSSCSFRMNSTATSSKGTSRDAATYTKPGTSKKTSAGMMQSDSSFMPPNETLLTSNQLNPTTIKVYVNKSTNKAYLIRDSHNTNVLENLPMSEQLSNPGPSSVSYGLGFPSIVDKEDDYSQMNPDKNLMNVSVIDRTASCHQQLTEASNLTVNFGDQPTKKIFLMVPNDRSIEEQLMDILPSLNL